MSRGPRKNAIRIGFWAAVLTCGAQLACGWDPSKPFERESPVVNRAISELDAEAGAANAAELLEGYLSTGACAESNIGTPKTLSLRPNGAFDLGIALFRIGESFGARFGDEESTKPPTPAPAPAPLGSSAPPSADGLRASHIECALRIVRAVADDTTQPVDLRARARYLEGNLLFMDTKYKEAVAAYDKALVLAPGIPEGGVDAHAGPRLGDPVGLDAAWNRAVALRRIEDKKDAGQDSGDDGGQDGSPPDSGQDGGPPDSGKDGGGDAGGDGGKDGGGDSGKDGGDDGNKDGGKDAESPPPPPKPQEDAGAPPPQQERSQDEKLLDQLENAPTVQREAARRQKRGVKVRGSEDK